MAGLDLTLVRESHPARRREWHILQAAKHEATLAVDLYNRPAQDRSLEAFVVHMNIA